MTDDELNRDLDKWKAYEFGLTVPQLNQLRSYVEWAEESGCFFKPKVHFDKRHQAIRRRLGMDREHNNGSEGE